MSKKATKGPRGPETLEFIQVFDPYVIGERILEPKFVGSSRFMIPEGYRKPTNVVRVLKAGASVGLKSGDLILVNDGAGHQIDDDLRILLEADQILGRIEGGPDA